MPNRIRDNSTQSRASYQHMVTKLGTCWRHAGNLEFSGTFAKLSWIFKEVLLLLALVSRNIRKHLCSPSEQVQVVATLSGQRLLRLLVLDRGERKRSSLPGLGMDMLTLQFARLRQWGHARTLPLTGSAGELPCISILCQTV